MEASEPPLRLCTVVVHAHATRESTFRSARVNERREIPKSSSLLTFRGDRDRAVTCAAGSPKVLSTTRMPTFLARSARACNAMSPFLSQFFVRVQKRFAANSSSFWAFIDASIDVECGHF